MENDINNPDIQNAPVYPIDFHVTGSKEDFSVSCTVYVPDKFVGNHPGISGYSVYLTILTMRELGTSVLAQQSSELAFYKSQLLKYNFNIKEDVTQFDTLNIQLAVAPSFEEGNAYAGASESLRVGRFVNTIIPVDYLED